MEVVKNTGRVENLTNAGKGRPKGVPNKNTTALKDMIIQALDGAGGVDYLMQQALDNPGPFMTLVGKVLPLQLTGEDGGAIQFEQRKLDDVAIVESAIAGLAARARAARVAGDTQH